jgi:ABC-type Mn2+/Zn2+ transport system ATPase subunit
LNSFFLSPICLPGSFLSLLLYYISALASCSLTRWLLAGYVEQLDVHLPTATVREALEFSALLRQPRSTPDKEKLAYVDTIIDLLELHDIEDALIGTPGAGLGIEQRKRLTIGVELVSRPKLMYLDEPTSGLDGQSSFLIVSFLRKLVDAGQAVSGGEASFGSSDLTFRRLGPVYDSSTVGRPVCRV